MSSSAVHHLSPAYPSRAPWGTAGALRAWQQAALDDYLARGRRDYLAVATPGAGKRRSPYGSQPSCSSGGWSTS